FGLGGDSAASGQGVDYALKPRGALAGGSYRFGQTPYWFGLRYMLFTTEVELQDPPSVPGLEPGDFGLDLAALTLTATLDTRNNFFTPTAGWYADLSVPFYREAFGSDRDFETLALTGMHYRPVSETLHFAVRATARTSTDDTPFFLRPYVMLRGVQALRIQGEDAAEIEAELRWQFRSRYSLVAFGGAGMARSETALSDRDESVTAGGVGFRYLVARRHGLHMGLDVAWGPDDPVLYVIVGSAWLRP
ncbi:MAG TPA: BamA/TamA family outer membrane protein, partial [Woeseiaceae bacterium]|nr:BamA/TamA family outer membrane protein [Woeseiaceae bacterium]